MKFLVRSAADSLMYGFATYGFVNFASHYVSVTGKITEPVALLALVTLFFLSRLVLNGAFSGQK